jgi:hypothetical protein
VRPLFTPEDDEVVKKYYTDKISGVEAEELTSKTLQSIRQRAKLLGLIWQPRRAKWAWIDNGILQEDGLF